MLCSVANMKKSFSLIEVLVFVSILALFFVAAMAVVTYSLRTMKTNEYKILASHYAEEGIEWLRGHKEDDWSVFTTLDSSAGSTVFCANMLDFSSPGPCGETYALGTPPLFKREITIENVPDSTSPDYINATVSVSWSEGLDVTVNTIFKLLE